MTEKERELAVGREGRRAEGKKANHKTARKLGPLSVIRKVLSGALGVLRRECGCV
jgi:hypothetical protein